MSKLVVRLERAENYGQILIVEHDGKEILMEQDYGEPEDNLFSRDYKWIPEIIEKAYRLGFEDGKKEGRK